MANSNPSVAHLCDGWHFLETGRRGCGSQTLRPILRRIVACMMTLASVWPTAAHSQLINPDIWLQSPVSTAFGVGANWNTGAVPITANEVRVDSTSKQFPVLNGGSYSPGPIYFSYDVGGTRTSSLTILNGGSLTTSLNVQGVGVVLALQSNTGTTVTVTGAGSQLTTSGSIWVGSGGSGTLNILDGGKVQSQGKDVAIGLTSTGSTLVTGAGSMLSVSGLLSLAPTPREV